MSKEAIDPRQYKLYADPLIPSLYEQVWSLNDRYQAEVDLVVKHWKSGGFTKKDVVIDLGCGTGNHLSILSRLGFVTLGLDINNYQLKRAGILFPELSGRLVDGSMESLPINDGSAQAVLIMSEAINYLNEEGIDRTLNEAERVMKKGGGLVIVSKWAKNLGGRGIESKVVNNIRYTKQWVTSEDDPSLNSTEAIWEATFEHLKTDLVQSERHYFPFMDPFGIARLVEKNRFREIEVLDIHSIEGRKIPLTQNSNERTAIILARK